MTMKVLKTDSNGVLIKKGNSVIHLTTADIQSLQESVNTEKTFRLYWRTGTTDVVRGRTVSEAMNKNGYGMGSIRALDFYSAKEEVEYTWNKRSQNWEAIQK